MTRTSCERSMTCCRKLSRVAKKFVRLKMFQPLITGAPVASRARSGRLWHLQSARAAALAALRRTHRPRGPARTPLRASRRHERRSRPMQRASVALLVAGSAHAASSRGLLRRRLRSRCTTCGRRGRARRVAITTCPALRERVRDGEEVVARAREAVTEDRRPDIRLPGRASRAPTSRSRRLRLAACVGIERAAGPGHGDRREDRAGEELADRVPIGIPAAVAAPL